MYQALHASKQLGILDALRSSSGVCGDRQGDATGSSIGMLGLLSSRASTVAVADTVSSWDVGIMVLFGSLRLASCHFESSIPALLPRSVLLSSRHLVSIAHPECSSKFDCALWSAARSSRSFRLQTSTRRACSFNLESSRSFATFSSALNLRCSRRSCIRAASAWRSASFLACRTATVSWMPCRSNTFKRPSRT